MNNRLSLVIVFLISILNNVQSQTSIDYVTGTANVNIPICSVKGSSMEFPVSLTYNTGGNKVNDVASWVGLGWNLNAGGAISREVRGLPDEMRSKKGFLIANDRYVQQAFIGEYYPGASGCSLSGQTPNQTIVDFPLTSQEMSMINSGEMDLEPDLFEVSLPGLSCKFSFGIDDQKTPSVFNPCYYSTLEQNGLAVDHDPIVCYPKQDIKITYQRDFDRIISFTIQNLDGFKYVFNSVQTIETSYRIENGPETGSFSYNVSWYITDIYSPEGGLEAHFEYEENVNPSRMTYYDETKAVSSSGRVTYSGDMDAWNAQDPFNGIGACIIDTAYAHTLMITSLKWKRIKTIQTKFGIVEFERGEEREDLPGDYLLKRVHLKTEDGLLLATTELSYKYSYSSNGWPRYLPYSTPQDKVRLTLQEVKRLDSQGNQIENATVFSYGIQLPPRNSYAQDHWGYFNQMSNQALVCEYNILTPWISFGPLREAGGLGLELQSIKLPNGGQQLFTYEQHDYGKVGTECYELHGIPDQLDVTVVEGDLGSQCYNAAQGGALIFSETFEVEYPQEVRLEYSYLKSNFTTISGCEDLNSYEMIHIRIREVQSNDYIFDRIIPSELYRYSGRELLYMESGIYSLEVDFEYYGKVDHTTHAKCVLTSYNYHSSSETDKLLAGGLRLKSLRTTDGDSDSSNDMLTTLEYTKANAESECENFSSSGVLLSLPRYEVASFDRISRHTTINHWSVIHTINGDGWIEASYDCDYKIRTSGSITPLLTDRGAFVLYSNVVVRNGSTGNGFSIYQYDIIDLQSTETLSGSVSNTRSWQNTALRRQLNYDAQGLLFSSVEYEYSIEGNQLIPCYQVKKQGQTGATVHQAIDIDHEALREVQKNSVIGAARSLVSIALSGGNTFTMAVTAATVVLDVFMLMRSTLLLAQNNDAELNEIENITVNHYVPSPYYLRTEDFKLKAIKSTEYDVTNPSIRHTEIRRLDDYKLYNVPTFIETYHMPDFENSHFGQRIKLSSDYDFVYDASAPNHNMINALWKLRVNGVKALPIEEIFTTINTQGQEFVIGGVLHEYDVDGNRVVLVRTWKWETTRPYPYNYFSWSECLGHSFVFDKAYRLVSEVEDFSDSGVPITFHEPNGIDYSLILEGAQDRAVGVIQNAMAKEVLYTSFESDSTSGFVYLGNACLSTVELNCGLEIPKAKTGKRYLEFSNEGLTCLLYNGIYELSFWASGDAIEVNVPGATVTLIVEDEVDILGWKFYAYRIDSNGSFSTEITLSTQGLARLDEVRYHPFDATMRTISYNRNGSIHNVCDENGRCAFYGYDTAHRQIWTMSDDYNIRESMVYPGLGENCASSGFVHRVALNERANYLAMINAPKNSLDYVTDLSFLDGLGRPLQQINLKQSPSGKDIVSQVFYDNEGRTTRTYLPYTRNYSGECFIESFLLDQQLFYMNCPQIAHTAYPYEDVAYDNTSRDRITEIGSVGEEWQLGGHSHKQIIEFNRLSDNVINWSCRYSDLMASQVDELYYKVYGGTNDAIRYWGSGQLKKVVDIDPNGVKSCKYYDHMGRLVLSRVFVETYGSEGMSTDFTFGFSVASQSVPNPTLEVLDTYYLYDEFGRIKFELTPEFIKKILLAEELIFSDNPNADLSYDLYFNLCYGYVYDLRGNLTEKHVPETKNYYLVYDDLNNLVMTQDAKQRQLGYWSLMKNDIFGRPLYTAKVNLQISRTALQHEYYSEFSGASIGDNLNFKCYETALEGGVFPNIYTRTNGPAIVNQAITEIYNYNYYDSFLIPQSLGSFVYGGSGILTKRLKGYQTGSTSRVLNSSNTGFANSTLHEISYYDYKGRLIEVQSQTIEGGLVREMYDLDWLGKVHTVRKHVKLSASTPELRFENRYQYDRTGRVLGVYQKTNDDPMIQLVGLEYNELGQIYRKHLHLAAGENRGMQVVDYRYNERGWLTSINNSNLADDGNNLEDDDVFGMNLLYFEDENLVWDKFDDSSITPKSFYGGQLAAITWNTKKPDADGTQEAEQTYVYRYDNLYRLTCSAYAKESFSFENYGLFTREVNSFLEKTDYDRKGGILKMSRNRSVAGHAFSIDDIKYGYNEDSYRLSATRDGAYLDDISTFIHYESYGGDLIGHYSYDELGNCIADSHKRIEYTYNDLGLLSSATPQSSTSCYFIYDSRGRKLAKRNGGRTNYYVSNTEFLAISGDISFVQASTGVGIVRPIDHESNGTEFIYDYFLTDHKGNVRAIVSEGNAEVRDELATMEITNASSENEAFNYISYSRKAVSLAYPATQETGQFLSELSSGTTSQGPSHLSEVMAMDNLQVSVQSWFNGGDENSAQSSVNQIVSSILADLSIQSAGVVGSELASSFANPNSTVSTGIFDFVESVLGSGSDMDLTVPQGYLVYFFLDENLNIDPTYSGAIQVQNTSELQLLQSDNMVMPAHGYFYTYLTNFSDQTVYFDNLSVRHKRGVLRAKYDYYTYGLMWGEVDGANHNYTFGQTEINANEWGQHGLDMNWYSARWYDPVLGRWHSPDPLEQFHSPYLAMCNDPANFVDPDGRAGIHILEGLGCKDELKMSASWAVVSAAWGRWLLGETMSTGLQTAGNILGGALGVVSLFSTVNQVISQAQNGVAKDYGGAKLGGMHDFVMPHSTTGLSYHGSAAQQLGLGNGDPVSANKTPDPQQIGWNFYGFSEIKNGWLLSFQENIPFGSSNIQLPYGLSFNLQSQKETIYILRAGFSQYYFRSKSDLYRAALSIDKKYFSEYHVLKCTGCEETNDFTSYLDTQSRKKEQWQNIGNATGNMGAAIGGLNLYFAATSVQRELVKANFDRFVSKVPKNSRSNASFKLLNDGNYLFQASSPGKVPGSSALYQKWVNPSGVTFKMTKTTFAPNGTIIHIKTKF